MVGGQLDLRGERLRLRVYVDHCMLVAYANGLNSLTTKIYPTRDDATGVHLWADGSLTVRSLEVWRLGSAYEGSA